MCMDFEEKQAWYPDFITPEQYIEARLDILRNDMYIEPTQEEIDHLYSLTDQHDIDRAIHDIIDRAWG